MTSDFRNTLDAVVVGAIMQSPPVTVNQMSGLSVAATAFLKNHVGHIIVVDDKNRPVGLLSHKYLYKTRSPLKNLQERTDYDPNIILDGDAYYEKDSLDSYILRDVMRKNPLTLPEGAKLTEAVTMMAAFNVTCVPVVDDKKKVVGVLGALEVIRHIAKAITEGGK